MSSYERSDPLQRIVLSICGTVLILVVGMTGWLLDRQQRTIDSIQAIQSMQAVQIATLQELVRRQGIDIERNTRRIYGERSEESRRQ